MPQVAAAVLPAASVRPRSRTVTDWYGGVNIDVRAAPSGAAPRWMLPSLREFLRAPRSPLVTEHFRRDVRGGSATLIPVAGERCDSELIELCRAGDSEAFGALFDRHRAEVTRLVFRMLGP